jgi:hypothetical protein
MTIFYHFINIFTRTQANSPYCLHGLQGRYDSRRPRGREARLRHQQEGGRRSRHHRRVPATQGHRPYRLHRDPRRTTIHQGKMLPCCNWRPSNLTLVDRLGQPHLRRGQATILPKLVQLQEEGLHQGFQAMGVRGRQEVHRARYRHDQEILQGENNSRKLASYSLLVLRTSEPSATPR